jgi:putative transposase
LRKEHVVKRSRFTEEQIAFALKQQELGTPVEEICREMGIAQATFFNWKKRFSGLGPSEPLSGSSQGSDPVGYPHQGNRRRAYALWLSTRACAAAARGLGAMSGHTRRWA